VHKQKSAILL